LEWEHDQHLAKEHALFPMGESGRDRRLVRVGQADAGVDGPPHPGPGGLVEAILEG
jgi:hypothetical protein